MAPGLSQNQSWFSVSQQSRGKEGRFLHGTQLPRERVRMLKALVAWEEDALAMSPGLGNGTVGMQPLLRVVISGSTYVHLRTLLYYLLQ